MAAPTRDDDELITGINVTPLVDVTLVLLVILMVTATYIASRAIPLDLPKASSGEGAPSTITVSIDRDGALWLDGASVNTAALRQRVRRARAEQRELAVVIAADGAARHRAVVSAMNLLREEGVSELAISVQPDDRHGP